MRFNSRFVKPPEDKISRQIGDQKRNPGENGIVWFHESGLANIGNGQKSIEEIFKHIFDDFEPLQAVFDGAVGFFFPGSFGD